MKLRQHTMVRDMSFEDIVDYIYDLEAEVRKMRTKSRAHRKSIREMQAKLEQQHLRQLVIEEWRELKRLRDAPAPPYLPYPYQRYRPRPQIGTPWVGTRMTCDTE